MEKFEPTQPDTVLDLPIKWADVRREAKTLTDQGGSVHVLVSEEGQIVLLKKVQSCRVGLHAS